MSEEVYKIDRNKVNSPEEIESYAFKRAMQRLEEIREAEEKREKIEDDDELAEIEREQKLEELEEENEPLAIDWKYTLTIELSTGGDADGFILELDKNKEVISGKYYWADWGKYQEIDLEGDEADKVADFYLSGDPGAFIS